MRSRGRWLWSAGAIAAVLVVAAASPGLSQQQTVLRWVYPGWDSRQQEEAVRSIVADYERQNPAIKIEIQNLPWAVMHSRLVVTLRSGAMPDMGYVIDRWLPEFQQQGFLEELTPRLRDVQKDDWFPGTWEAGTYGDKVYSLPDRQEPYVFFYNRGTFQRAGIAEFPPTMREFVAAAQKLTAEKVSGVGIIGGAHPTLPGYFLNYLYAFNGSVLSDDGRKVTINDERGVEALQFYVDLYHKYKVAQRSAVTDTRDEVRRLFITEQVAMEIESLWFVATLRDLAPRLNYGIGKIPQVEGRKRQALSGGWHNVVFSGSRNKDAAWAFLRFYTQPENMAKAVVTLPARKTAFSSARFQDPSYRPWLDALQYTKPNPKTPYYEAIMQELGDGIQNALYGRMSVRRALDQTAERMQAIISK